MAEADLEPRLRALVRRELLTLDIDPRSPERGQYAFVQALIREVAYNTLARRDRRPATSPPRAASSRWARRARGRAGGALPGRPAERRRRPEADALAAQARVALRAAAERAVALGSHEQAIAFLEQALEVTTDPADRAGLHEERDHLGGAGLDPAVVLRHAKAAVLERRRPGDREAIAAAIAEQARVLRYELSDPAGALAVLTEAWAEYSDLEATAAGVELMSAFASSYRGSTTPPRPSPGRTGSCRSPSASGTLTRRRRAHRAWHVAAHGRPAREGIILLRGAHQLAIANDLHDRELNARVLMTFFEQWGEPAAGLALAREGLEIGRRLGSRAYGFKWSGTAASARCARATGTGPPRSWTSGWPLESATASGPSSTSTARSSARAWARTRLPTSTRRPAPRRGRDHRPAVGVLRAMGRGVGRLLGGPSRRGPPARRARGGADDLLRPAHLPARHPERALGRRRPGAASALALLEASGYLGPALAADRLAARAGIDALEGRGPAALAGYREALRAYRQLGLVFDEAVAVVDMAILLSSPERDPPDVAAAIAAARETLERLGARPFLVRLDASASRSAAS